MLDKKYKKGATYIIFPFLFLDNFLIIFDIRLEKARIHAEEARYWAYELIDEYINKNQSYKGDYKGLLLLWLPL
jgi:hypothetical protein